MRVPEPEGYTAALKAGGFGVNGKNRAKLRRLVAERKQLKRVIDGLAMAELPVTAVRAAPKRQRVDSEEESEQAHEPLPSSSDEEEETSAVPPWAAAAGKTREQLDAEEHARQLAHTHFGQAVWYPQEPTDLTPFEFIRKKAA
jgi:hypothetical protein